MAESTLTWADVAEDSALEALTIEIHAFGETTSKRWVKASMDDWHWQRIVAIAETTADEFAARPAGGFSWVSSVVVDGKTILLAPPAAIADHLQE